MALLAMVAIVVMGVGYMLASRINAASRFIAVDREYNARVLNQAKQALIGWVALNAAQTDNNPGRLPCPEAVNSIGTDSEGISAPQISPATPNCATVGRLPWRTLGLDKLVDAAAEPLWYVVSPGWALQNSSTLLTINSNSRGTMVIDGQAAPNDVFALIIAPGQAMNVQTATGCTARAQARGTPAPTIDPRDYVECFNAATPPFSFSTIGTAASFNDQVLKITAADLLPALEAAIAHRMEREIAPALRNVYASLDWGTSTTSPLFPFAARFDNPHPGSATYRGDYGRYQGLLPVNRTQGCTWGLGNERCQPSLLSFAAFPAPDAVRTAGSGSMSYKDCTLNPPISADCTIEIRDGNATIAMTTVINNVAMGLRSLSLAGTELWKWNSSWQPISGQCQSGGTPPPPPPAANCTLSATLSSSGAATMRVQANLTAPNPGSTFYYIRLYLTAAGDHPLLDASTTGPGAATSWFVRNEWYRLVYYAVARGHTADKLPPVCPTAVPFISSCLSVANVTPPNAQRAILILAGRSINGSARPSSTLSDYLEFGNAKGTFERQTVTPAPPAPYVDTGAANAYVVSAASPMVGMTFYFRAANSNTGASTLTTPATGPKNLVNLDGSNLAASTIQAFAAVQVAYDGSRFLLSKRPFNDRIVIVDSN